MKLKQALFFTLIAALLAGCSKPVFLEHRTLPSHSWDVQNEIPFQVNIPDAGTYRLSFLIRFTEDYPWSNLWLTTTVAGKDYKTLFSERFNIPLSDKEGRPLQGMTGAFADRTFPSPALEQMPLPIGFKEAGTYTIKLKQEMRNSRLEGIASVALKLERVD